MGKLLISFVFSFSVLDVFVFGLEFWFLNVGHV